MNSGPLDLIPLWLFLPLTMLVSLLVLEVGYKFRVQKFTAENLANVLAESETLHEQMWQQAAASAEIDPHAIITGLFRFY